VECGRLGVGILPYFPLANGLLTGKYRRGEAAPSGTRLAGGGLPTDEATFDRLDALAAYAAARELTMTDVAIGALAVQPQVASVIAGATSADQVRANAHAARWTPGREDLDELDAIFPTQRTLRDEPSQ
jgi:aryl-alcohol dehydrogenase-like predicted oxidoreductase